MTTKTVNLYTFDELSPKAKERAREWWRELESQDFGGFGDLYEPIETAAKLLGIEFARHSVGLCGGGSRSEPRVWWTLHVQGSGASYEATYSYAKGSVKAIKSEFARDMVLHGIATDLAAIQKRHMYGVTADIKADSRYHSLSVDTSVSNADDDETLTNVFKRFAEWIYKQIDEEYTYRMADENVDESILANGYTFTEDGRRED